MPTQTDAVSTGSAHEVDLKLAAKVAAGGLRADVLVQAVTSTFLLSWEKCLRNKRRHTTGSCVKDAAVQDALCQAMGPKCNSS